MLKTKPKIKSNIWYFDQYTCDFFKIVKITKHSHYPYKIKFKNGFDEKTKHVTESYLTELALIECKYSDKQVKELSKFLKHANAKNNNN